MIKLSVDILEKAKVAKKAQTRHKVQQSCATTTESCATKSSSGEDNCRYRACATSPMRVLKVAVTTEPCFD